MKRENKKTYTFATPPSVKEKAARKAEREGLTLSEKIDAMLKDYVKPIPKVKLNSENFQTDYRS